MHPVLFAVYPAVFLYSHNGGFVSFDEAYRALAVSCLLGAGLLGLGLVLFRERHAASLVAAIAIVMLFAYGPVRAALEGRLPDAVDLRTSYGLIAFLIVAEAGVLVAVKRWDLSRVSAVLFAVSATLVVLGLLPLAARAVSAKPELGGSAGARAATTSHSSRLPDVYYVILDGYGRDDVLRELYGHDNDGFVGELERRGFVVARRSRANYSQTMLSLGSSLNMMHLDGLVGRATDERGLDVLPALVANNEVVRSFKERGYLFVNVSSGFSGTDPSPQADVTLSGGTSALNEFELLLIDSTPLGRALERFLTVGVDPFVWHRERVLAQFAALREMPDPERPMFVFVHVLAPHPPFVFDRDGNLPPQPSESWNRLDGRLAAEARDRYVRHYSDQVHFLNRQVLASVDAVLGRAKAGREPVIILQGDHGPASRYSEDGSGADYRRERMAILNAFHVPDDVAFEPYETMTPVNTFRMLSDALFGTQLGRLPDLSRFSNYRTPYEFVAVDEAGQ